jgi:glycosyltransferase involved in cell wall biosynthesis
MLLVLHAPFRIQDGQIWWDSQACNGAEQWADSFGSVIVAAPVISEALAVQNTTTVWRNTATLNRLERFELVPLPWAYSLPQFLQTYARTRQQLAQLVQRCRYIQVAIGGLFGDWAAVAALEAHRQSRKCAVHADRVEHRVVLNLAQQAGWRKQLQAKVHSSLMARFERYVIQRSSLGLWHGQDCYAAYSPFCAASYVIHDVHIKPETAISPEDLNRKLAEVSQIPILQICYAGRIAPMKAPLDWVRALDQARSLGVLFRATWFGDGKLKADMQALIAELALDDWIELYGFESNQDKLLARMRQAHLMLFTHITPESPRCLIEALASGTPIVGYASAYTEELTATQGGGSFVPIQDWQSLGQRLADLHSDRPRLQRLIRAAAANGARFNDRAVFQQRSELIKQHL